jgi:hypothetical protein
MDIMTPNIGVEAAPGGLAKSFLWRSMSWSFEKAACPRSVKWMIRAAWNCGAQVADTHR